MTPSGLIARPPGYASLAAALLLVTSIGHASNWTQIAVYQDGTSLSVDETSIASSGKYRRGWFKFRALQAADLPDSTIPSTTVPTGQKFTYVVELFYAKCAKHSAALIEANFYAADDSLLGNIPPTAVNHADFEEAPAGSAGDKIIRILCKTG